MPVSVAHRRPKLSLVAAAPNTVPAEELCTVAYSLRLASAFAGRPVLRIGDYEVGETFCPHLCGHPGIRY